MLADKVVLIARSIGSDEPATHSLMGSTSKSNETDDCHVCIQTSEWGGRHSNVGDNSTTKPRAAVAEGSGSCIKASHAVAMASSESNSDTVHGVPDGNVFIARPG